MTHKHGRTDANQIEIVAALRAAGAVVTILSDAGNGIPDTLSSFRDKWYLAEIKMPGKKLTKCERDWMAEQQAAVHILYTTEDALKMLGVI